MRASLVTMSVLAAALGGAACSSPDGAQPFSTASSGASRTSIVLRPEAVRAPQSIANVADVRPSQIVLPRTRANEAWARTLSPGNVIAGNRDTSSPSLERSKNAYGFLRKVATIDVGADAITIATEPAWLDDLVEEGTLVLGGDGPSIFEDAEATTATTVSTSTLRPLSDKDDDRKATVSMGSGEAELELGLGDGAEVKASLSNGRFQIGASFAGELRFGWNGVEKASARLELDPHASVTIELGAKVAGTLREKKWEGRSVPIPLGGPVPLTLRVRPKVKCEISASGATSWKGQLELRGHAVAGFDYVKDGDFQRLVERPSFVPGLTTIGTQGKAGIDGECSVTAVLSVLAFDALGLEGELGPYVKLEGEFCNNQDAGGERKGFTLSASYGIKAEVSGRLQVPGLAWPSYVEPVFGYDGLEQGPIYAVGDEDTCSLRTRDSCAGRADGLYCSELTPFSAFQCVGGQIAGGQQCASGQRCKGPNGPGTTIQCE